jgi:hypothetical protein
MDVIKPSLHKGPTQSRSIKPLMEYGVIVTVKVTIIGVQVGNAKESSRRRDPVK